MRSITIELENGEIETFEHVGRAGGSYTISIRYEGEFAIVKNEWGHETAFPTCKIKKIKTEQFSRF